MDKLLRPLVIVTLLLSIAGLVLGIMLFGNRELLKGRTQKHAEAAMALAQKLTKGQDPYIEQIDTKLNQEELFDYEKMDVQLETLSKIAGTRLDALYETAQDLKNTRDELSRTLDDLARTKQELSAARIEIDRLEGELATTEQQLAQANGRIDTLELEQASLKEEITGLNEKVANLEIEKEDLVAKNDELESKIIDLTGRGGSGMLNTTPIGLKGEVVLVKSEWNFIVVDLGKANKLAPMTRMLVHRDDHLVGAVKSTMIDENIAVCEINRDFEKMPIQKGDTVFYPGVSL